MSRHFLSRALAILSCLPTLVILAFLLGSDTFIPRTTYDRVRSITAPYEFEFISWEADAIWSKIVQFTLGEERYLSASEWHDIVIDYNHLMDDISREEDEVQRIFSDPTIADPMQASSELRAELAQKRSEQAGMQSLVEAILQDQISAELRAEGFAIGGEVIPPVLFRFSPIPCGLIISPREVIRVDANIQLIPGLPLETQIALEQEAESKLGVSALVVPFGGLGTYPTMIMETSWTNWVVEAVAHEWTHNYLTLTPLGLGYDASADLRTINETAASLVGKSIGARVIQHNYSELALPDSPAPSGKALAAPALAFDYQHEMYVTRVEADRLLAEGKIDEAEQYMEQRRQFIMAHFAEHGHTIRRLNQAFFAFYGTYADVPGERGEDPVGPLVVALFDQCPSTGAFLRTISHVTSLQQLRDMVTSGGRCG
jgi:hypothetical protein